MSSYTPEAVVTCRCGQPMRLVPVHHRVARRTTWWPVCGTCWPGQPAAPAVVPAVEPRLTVVRSIA